MSNYTNHLVQAPVDRVFAGNVWPKASVVN